MVSISGFVHTYLVSWSDGVHTCINASSILVSIYLTLGYGMAAM